MSCCGQVRAGDNRGNVPAASTLQPFPISDQPTAHPSISPFGEKSSFHPPGISSPPPVHSISQFNETHSPPPPSTTTHGSLAPSPPPQSPQNHLFLGGSSLDPSLNTLRRPSPSYPAASGIPNLLSTYRPSIAAPVPSAPVLDEGKVSVSIDFGKLLSTYTVELSLNGHCGPGTTFSGVVSISLPLPNTMATSNHHASYRRMARRALLPERYNKFYNGREQWRLLGKFRLVCCMMSVDKSSLGAWRRKTPTQCPDRSSVNGTTS